ncbi:hypothetical protein LAZ67_7002945 [Cordylochernes scorpioides]|uniref:Cytochrome P450 n=1 Tax=Cordylochernes scorpioides TaxID=51811 RepID=A0ABY6KNI3_9ARAC|nr:hypothetical protein LAZ67_7002945 [Cordylochernes scorpioides]
MNSEDFKYKNWTFPARTVFQVPMAALHRMPQLWDDPETFDPDRFGQGQRPDSLNFQPFGAGPRQCPGLRYARLEVQAFFAQMLRKFKIKPSMKMPISVRYHLHNHFL